MTTQDQAVIDANADARDQAAELLQAFPQGPERRTVRISYRSTGHVLVVETHMANAQMRVETERVLPTVLHGRLVMQQLVTLVPGAVFHSVDDEVEIPALLPPDTVNHPSHYNSHPSGVECIAVVEHFNFNVGNAIKYLWRAGLKPGSRTRDDLQKAEWYVRRELERLDASGPR